MHVCIILYRGSFENFNSYNSNKTKSFYYFYQSKLDQPNLKLKIKNSENFILTFSTRFIL